MKKVTGKPVLQRLCEVRARRVVSFEGLRAIVEFERGHSSHRALMTLPPRIDDALPALAHLTSRPSTDPHLVEALREEWTRLKNETDALVASELRALVAAAGDLLSEDDVVTAWREGQCKAVLSS